MLCILATESGATKDIMSPPSLLLTRSMGMTAQCLLPSVETFTANGDLDLENRDHLKCVILKIKIRSPKQRDLDDQDHAHLCL